VAKRRQRVPVRPPPKAPTWPPWAVAGAAVLVVVVVAVIVVVINSGSSKSSGSSTASTSVSLPRGTVTFSENDHTHTTAPVKYDHDPPAGGAHNPVPQNCGIYAQPVPNEHAVHSLEHGSVWVTYQPSLPAAEVDQLRQLVTDHYVGSQRYLLMSPYPGLSHPIVASAWGAQLVLDSPGDPRLIAFIQHFQGGDQGGEQGAPCTAGFGTPDA
jgi:hypothetical protein